MAQLYAHESSAASSYASFLSLILQLYKHWSLRIILTTSFSTFTLIIVFTVMVISICEEECSYYPNHCLIRSPVPLRMLYYILLQQSLIPLQHLIRLLACFHILANTSVNALRGRYPITTFISNVIVIIES